MTISSKCTTGDGEEYRSAFTRWPDLATVRKPGRRAFPSEEPGTVYFPPEMVPMLEHPAVVGLGPRVGHRLLARRLLEYLNFTTELELTAVLPVTALIARRRSGLALPEQMETDAFAITTDESWHAQFTDALMSEVERETQVRRDRSPIELHRRLAAVRDALPQAVLGLDQLLFAAVSETLISEFLSDLPDDPRLPRRVRETISDHALDEGRHHAYFRQFLPHMWGQLTLHERSALGAVVPSLIHAFLLPDLGAATRALVAEGMSLAEAHVVVEESMSPSRSEQEAASAARRTVQYFAGLSVLDDPKARDEFEAAGLLAALR